MLAEPFPPASEPELPDPPPLVSIDSRAGRITVHGELDRVSVHSLTDAVAVLVRSTTTSWSIDVSAVTSCDVAGLRSLARPSSGRRPRVTA